MNKLTKELEKFKKERMDGQQEIVQEAKLLLSSSEAKERTILKNIGLDAHLNYIEDKTRLNRLNEEFEKKYDGQIFHINEIKRLSIKYRLFFKLSRNYRGHIPADLGAILARMSDKHNTHTDAHKFFILAPPYLFKDYKTVGDKISKCVIDTKENTKHFLNDIVNPDPTLFYKIDEEHYKLVKQWGSDFTILRAAIGFFTKNSFWLRALIIVPFLYMLYAYIKGIQLGIAINGDKILMASITIGGASIIISYIFMFFPMLFGKNNAIYNTKNFSTKVFWEKFQ